MSLRPSNQTSLRMVWLEGPQELLAWQVMVVARVWVAVHQVVQTAIRSRML